MEGRKQLVGTRLNGSGHRTTSLAKAQFFPHIWWQRWDRDLGTVSEQEDLIRDEQGRLGAIEAEADCKDDTRSVTGRRTSRADEERVCGTVS